MCNNTEEYSFFVEEFPSEEPTDELPSSENEVDLEFGGIKLEISLENLRRKWLF
jgi:hypothetical protein